MISKNCKILDLTEEEIEDFSKVKKRFRAKMIENSMNKEKRTELTLAYYDICNKIFKNSNEK
jgi:hypothetical protein